MIPAIRSTLKLIALSAAAFFIYRGETSLSAGELGDGSLLFLAAAAVLITAFRPAAELGCAPWTAPPPPTDERKLGPLRILLAGIFLFATLFCFFSNMAQGAGWIFLTLTFLTVAAGDLLRSPLELPRAVGRFCRKEPFAALFLAVLTGAALFLRIYRLSDFPPGLWFDEANIGLTAERILSLPGQMPVFFGEGLEQPALHFITVAGFVKFLGANIFALRLPSTIIGSLAVIPMYFLALQLFRKRQVAVLAAILLCCSGWHMNFSRWSANAIFSNFFDLIALTLLVYGFRTNRRMYFIWAGLSLGIGLNFYHASRTWALCIAAVSGLWYLRSKFSGRQFANLCSAAAATIVVVAPLIEFSIQYPEIFYKHTSELNVFKTTDSSSTDNAIVSNTRLHLLMFNHSGDAMTRHNAPAEPVLEPVTGTLFALGTALALLYLIRFEFALLLISMFCALLGGILSKPVDLPTSLRTIDCSIPVHLLAAFAGCSLIGAVASVFKGERVRTILLWIGALSIAAVTSIRSVDKFARHMQMGETWVGFNGPHRAIAEHIIEAGLKDSETYMPEVYLGQPTLLFLLKEAAKFLPFHDNLLPLDRVKDYFICRNKFDSISKLEAMYPTANRFVVQSPNQEPRTEGICFDIKIADVAQTLGINTWISHPDDKVDPAQSIAERFLRAVSEPVSTRTIIEQRAAVKILVPGTLRLNLESEGNTSVFFQGDRILLGSGESQIPLPVGTFVIETRTEIPVGSKGNYALSVRHFSTIGGQETPAILFRSPPVVSGGLLGSYYRGMLWEDEPQLTRVDPEVDFYFHLHPVPQPNSILWQGDLLVPQTGLYRFRASAIDYIQVYLDGNLLLADHESNADPQESQSITLTEGKHPIVVAYASVSGYAGVELSWETPNGGGKIPWNNFLPRDLKVDLGRIREDAAKNRRKKE